MVLKVGEGVTERHVALAKKHWKKREVGEGEGKLLENCGKNKKMGRGKHIGNCWKIEEKKRKGREVEDKGGKGRTRERREGLLHDTANVVLPCPVQLCTKSDHVRTASVNVHSSARLMVTFSRHAS